MAQVTATAEAIFPVPPAEALTALADYTGVRAETLTSHYTDYAVVEGGTGAGTVVTWRLHATEKRIRHVVADVTTGADSVTEKDRNSTLVTVFTVTADGHGSKVVATTTWQGAGGIGGFFEKTFAPKGLGRIHTELLERIAERLSPTA